MPAHDVLLTTAQVAERLSVSPRSVEGWRSRGGHVNLPFRRIGKQVRYLQSDVEALIAEARRESTSDPGPAPRRVRAAR